MGVYIGTDSSNFIRGGHLSTGVVADPVGSFPSDVSDTLTGLAGEDTLIGEGGDDFLYGGDQKDHLYGESGMDMLDGGSGNDDMTGGDGEDTFDLTIIPQPELKPGGIFSGPDYRDNPAYASVAELLDPRSGSVGEVERPPVTNDTITDFDAHQDHILLPEGAISKVSIIDGDTKLMHPGGTLTLRGVDLSGLPEESLLAYLSGDPTGYFDEFFAPGQELEPGPEMQDLKGGPLSEPAIDIDLPTPRPAPTPPPSSIEPIDLEAPPALDDILLA